MKLLFIILILFTLNNCARRIFDTFVSNPDFENKVYCFQIENQLDIALSKIIIETYEIYLHDRIVYTDWSEGEVLESHSFFNIGPGNRTRPFYLKLKSTYWDFYGSGEFIPTQVSLDLYHTKKYSEESTVLQSDKLPLNKNVCIIAVAGWSTNFHISLYSE